MISSFFLKYVYSFNTLHRWCNGNMLVSHLSSQKLLPLSRKSFYNQRLTTTKKRIAHSDRIFLSLCVCECDDVLSLSPSTSVTRCWSKSCPNVSKSHPRSGQISFYIKVWFFKIAQKVDNNLGYFCQKFCHQALSKIAQSGHAAFEVERRTYAV